MLEKATYPNYFEVDLDVVLDAFRSQPEPITFTPNITAVNSVMFQMVQSGYITGFISSENMFELEIIQRLESSKRAAALR